MKLKWFLVEYDRHRHELRKLTEYAEPEQRDKAWRELRRLEESQADELQRSVKTGVPLRMEYVLLLAESEEAIRVSHGNYFNGSHLSVAEYREIMAGKREAGTPCCRRLNRPGFRPSNAPGKRLTGFFCSVQVAGYLVNR